MTRKIEAPDEMAKPGDVIVVDAGGDLTNALFGEIIVAGAVKSGLEVAPTG